MNSKGRQFLVLEEIYDHWKDGTALEVADGYMAGHNGNRTPKSTTCGWQLCVKMKEEFTDLLSLKDLKEINPVDISECAVSNKTDHEPAFACWVPYTL